MTACKRCCSEPGSTASWKKPAERTTPRPWAHPQCRPVATSACTWSGPSRGSTASAGSSGAARTHSRYASSSAWSQPTGFRAIPGCRRRGAACPMRCMKRCSAGLLSKTRSRLPHEVHETVFGWVLALIAERGLVRGERMGVDASTLEANAALRAIVRRDTGEGYREMLTRMAQESGIETPTAEDLIRLDRNRTGKRLSNEEWVSETDPGARIARMKDGTTHLAYKPEHAIDLDTGAVVAAEMHPADQGDTTTISSTLD